MPFSPVFSVILCWSKIEPSAVVDLFKYPLVIILINSLLMEVMTTPEIYQDQPFINLI